MFASQRRYQVRVSHSESLLAHGIVAVLSRESDIDVRLAENEGQWQQADVLIADYAVALDVLQAARRRAMNAAGPRVVVLSTAQREPEVRRAIELGVQGFLMLGHAMDDLATAVRAVGAGARYYDSAVAERMAQTLFHEPLTERESEVLQLLTCGLCNKAIARDLTIAVGTVKAHVKAIFAKLEATSRTHASSIALQRGLVQVPDRDH